MLRKSTPHPPKPSLTEDENMYAESSVMCPAHWLATAFTRHHLPAHHYQYSVPFASHGADLAAFFGPPTENLGPDLVLAFQSPLLYPHKPNPPRLTWEQPEIFTNFITTNTPSLSPRDANGRLSADPEAPHPASDWPVWPAFVNINQTGGEAYTVYVADGRVGVTQFRGKGLRNAISVVGDAGAWEGGRGGRCDVWRGLALGGFVPL